MPSLHRTARACDRRRAGEPQPPASVLASQHVPEAEWIVLPPVLTGICDSASRPIFSRPMVRGHGRWTPLNTDRSPLTLDTMVGWLAL
jgi:hypothetical protein